MILALHENRKLLAFVPLLVFFQMIVYILADYDKVYQYSSPSGQEWELTGIDWHITSAILLGTMLLYALSWVVSVWIFSKKDF